jgi:uncharacterized iron-regulated protein
MQHLRLFSFSLLFLILVQSLTASNKPAYQIFDKEGRAVRFGEMAGQAGQSLVVLFGELHNNPIAHWLQYELSLELHLQAGDRLILGAEMFESDNQLILNEYLDGLITESNFRAEARLWRNYETDYRPLVELARENDLPFIATNIPRRYAALVNRSGFEGLAELDREALRYIAPLPVPYDPDLPSYRAMLHMGGMPAHVSENLPKAQAIKDATMAYFIWKNLQEETLFLHFNGAYHSNHYEGIVWYLRQYDKDLPLMTISTVEQRQTDMLEAKHLGLADYIIVVPENMTKTY